MCVGVYMYEIMSKCVLFIKVYVMCLLHENIKHVTCICALEWSEVMSQEVLTMCEPSSASSWTSQQKLTWKLAVYAQQILPHHQDSSMNSEHHLPQKPVTGHLQHCYKAYLTTLPLISNYTIEDSIIYYLILL
jgi:hypothetical protein